MRGLSMWFISVETMPELKEIVGRVLLPLQFSLGIWQIMKVTPVWAVMHCVFAYLIDCFGFPCTDYNQLKKVPGGVFKKARSHAMTAVALVTGTRTKTCEKSEINLKYLGESFCLTRKGGNIIEMHAQNNDGKKGSPITHYYITDEMWDSLQNIENVLQEEAEKAVFVKNHKEISDEVLTGDILSLPEVMESVILDNHAVMRLHHDYFLPVNLLLAEDKLLKIFNFVGLFLQTQKHVHWLIPASLSFTSLVMGFTTTWRLSVDDVIGLPFCRAVQLLCDQLPLSLRRRVYCWGDWVEHLKPSNDLQSRIVRDSIIAVVAAGAKVHFESLADSESLDVSVVLANPGKINAQSFYKYKDWFTGGPFLFKCESTCGLKCISICESVYIEWIFDGTRCWLKAGRVASQESLMLHDFCIACDDCDGDDCTCEEDTKLALSSTCSGQEKLNRSLIVDDVDTSSVDVECSRKEAKKLLKFASYMAEHKSGLLKSFDCKTNTVYVRRFVDSINTYVRNNYPPLYKLHLHNVVVR